MRDARARAKLEIRFRRICLGIFGDIKRAKEYEATIAEAYGGLATVAQEAGVTREALYRTLSPSGNPTLKPLLAVLHEVGMRLSVVPAAPTPTRG